MMKPKILLEGESRLHLQPDNNTAERFVAFLDIMGFKDRVVRTEHDELLGQLSEFNKEITGQISRYNESEIQLAQFSDSIVLFSNDVTSKSLKNLAEVSRGIMQIAIKSQIPIKGAIAQGKVTCDISKQLFFGQALIDAYLLEESIHYYGILVHHTAEKSVIELADDSIFKDVKAPLKSGCISHYELSWYVGGDVYENEIDNVKDCLRKIRQTVSDAPRKYIDNTMDVIEKNYK